MQESWTAMEGIEYEAAIECISDVSSILTAQIWGERKKAQPDEKKIAAWRQERSALWSEQKGLDVHDHTHIERIRREYGARARSHRAATQAQASVEAAI